MPQPHVGRCAMVHGAWWLVVGQASPQHGGRRWWVRVRILFLGLKGRGGRKNLKRERTNLLPNRRGVFDRRGEKINSYIRARLRCHHQLQYL
eukprot:scaffold967_cov148-Skeletonema_menzelii.AAC.23